MSGSFLWIEEDRRKLLRNHLFTKIRLMWSAITNWMRSHFLPILIVAAVLPILIYVLKFHDYKLSNDPADWGVFGDYIGGVYSVLIALLVVYLTRNLSRHDEEKRLKKEALREVYKQITNIQQ